MALKSNRVGVRTDQVDAYGRVTSKSFLQSILDHLPRWTSLKVWKNGTEQLLPVNTDEPVTSPIVADIQYPTDSSATEQMFTYRESPTDADGEAYIQSIKGNTIVWNQLYQPVSQTTQIQNDVTFTYSNGTWTTSGTPSTGGYLTLSPNINLVPGHKYLLNGSPAVDSIQKYMMEVRTLNNNRVITTDLNGSKIATVPSDSTDLVAYVDVRFGYTAVDMTGLKFTPQLFDLTQIGYDYITTVDQFTALFPLPYYKYDAGSLLSFNGTSIKTVGKNLFNKDALTYGKWLNSNTGAIENASSAYAITEYIPVIGGVSYKTSDMASSRNWLYDENKNPLTRIQTFTFTPSVSGYFVATVYTGTADVNTIQIVAGSTLGEYEPYKSSTTSIPTDTYFPTGMKSAGTVYDEFTSSRAYTRIGEVDLGTLTWSYLSSETALRFYATLPSDAKNVDATTVANAITSKYPVASWNSVAPNVSANNMFALTGTYITIRDTSYTNATVFKTAMDGVMLQYELAEEIIEPTLEFDEE